MQLLLELLIVDDLHTIENLYSNGFFGKGSLLCSILQMMLTSKNNPLVLIEPQYNSAQSLMNDMNLYNKIYLKKCIIL